ncbi:MAG: GUN4 domain-containing protein, partial [Nostocales cyanobacterium ELA583]
TTNTTLDNFPFSLTCHQCRRGEDFYKRRDFEAACQDFDRAIGLGYVKAAARREIVVQVQESIKDEEIRRFREQAFQQKLLEEQRLSQLKTSKADFRQLDQLLSAGKWQEADQETTKLILKCANREKEGYLDIDDCRNFPQEELRIIDQLWLKYSQNRFGFSVQKKIWVDNGGELDGIDDSDTRCKLADKVGWRKGGNWLHYSELTFNTNALPGHLPAVINRCDFGELSPSLLQGEWSFLFSKL